MRSQADAERVAPHHLGHDPGRLLRGPGEADHLDQLAAPLAGEQGLAQPPRVAGDHRVGRVQDVPGRAEVLLQAHLRRFGEVLLELADEADVAAPEPVDALVVVAHHEDVAVIAGQRHEPHVLAVVDILVLVGEDAVEAAGPAPPVGFVALHRQRRPQQQVAEVGGVGVAQAALVFGVEPGHGFWAGGVGEWGLAGGRVGRGGVEVGQRVLRGDERVLELVDHLAE